MNLATATTNTVLLLSVLACTTAQTEQPSMTFLHYTFPLAWPGILLVFFVSLLQILLVLRKCRRSDKAVARISQVACAFPKYTTSKEECQKVADHVIDQFHVGKNPDAERLRAWNHKVIQQSGISSRRLCVSSSKIFGQEEPSQQGDSEYEFFGLGNFNPSGEARAAAYRHHSKILAIQASNKAIQNWGGRPADITHVVAVTTTGWDEPGLASKVIDALDLPPTTEKYELCFNGCFAGVTGLRLAKTIYEGKPNAAILVVAAEVASIHYNSTSFDREKLLGNHLFGDGAGATVISSRGDWSLEDFGNYIVPGSAHILKMHQSTDPNHGGFEMTLSKELASVLKNAFMGKFGTTLYGKILSNCGIIERPAFCLHPGGKRILQNVKDACAKFHLGHLPEENFDVMAEHGNMATVSIFAVLERYLPKADRDNVILLGFGPGVTIEHGFLKRVGGRGGKKA